MRRFPDHLLKVPQNDAERGRAWPSPRSWELAARAWAGARALKAGDGVALKLVVAAVGDGVANECFQYLRELDLPDPEEILSGTAKVPLKRPDQTYASLAGVCAVAVLPHANKSERVVRAFEVAAVVAGKSADVAAACLAAVCKPTELQPLFRETRFSTRLLAALGGPLKEVAAALRGGK